MPRLETHCYVSKERTGNIKCPICKSSEVDEYIDLHSDNTKLICQKCFYIFEKDKI